MNWRLGLLGGVGLLVAVGGLWGMSVFAPWWRVEVRNQLGDIGLDASRVRIAWVLGQLGVWKKGVRVRYQGDVGQPMLKWRPPDKVVFVIDKSERDREKFLDGPSGKVLYGSYDEVVDGNNLVVYAGLPNIDFFGEPKKMTAILNSQLLKTMMRLSRETMISYSSFVTQYQVLVKSLPKEMITKMVVIR